MNATYNEHTSPLFKATNILKLTDLHDVQVIKFMGKFMHNELTLPLLELFQSQVVNHAHDTRHRDGPNLPLSHSEIMRRSIFHRGSIPVDEPPQPSENHRNNKRSGE